MIKHPTNRAERLKINEKKTKPNTKIKFKPFAKQRLREELAAQEAEHALRSIQVDPDLSGQHQG